MAGTRLKARLTALESAAKELSPTVALFMPDGRAVRVPLMAPVDIFCEVIQAMRENRKPSHRYLDAVMMAREEEGGGSLCRVAQSIQQSRELYGPWPDGRAEKVRGGGEQDG